MLSKTDILILGAGPAGASMALMLLKCAPQLKVRIVDKSNAQGEKIGETLPPKIQELMQPLGIWESFQQQNHLPAYATSAVWGDAMRHENDFLLQTSAQGWRIDKSRFNQFLIQETQERGARIQLETTARFVGKSSESFHFQLTGKSGNTEDLSAAFVVDATGRAATFATQMGAHKVRFDNLTGIWRFYQLPKGHAGMETLVEAFENGWWYSASLPDDKLVVACMTDSDLVSEDHFQQNGWQHLLQSAPQTQQRVALTEGTGAVQFWPAASQYLDTLCGEGWLAVGDAAGTFDPLSAQGNFKAMKSGIFGAYAALDYLNGKAEALEKYKQIMRREYEAYLELRAQYYQKEQRWPQSLFWQRRYDWLTLHPFSMLVSTNHTAPKNTQSKYLLSGKEEAFILDMCSRPTCAKEVVAAFRNSPWAHKKDRNIILGLQFLLEKQALQALS